MTTLTEWALRDRAAEAGYPVSGQQFSTYREWGLIPDPNTDRRWPEEMTGRLIRIRELGESVWSLPRRVVLLKCEGVPVPADRLREAMWAIVPTIPKPARTMKRIHNASNRLAAPAASTPSRRQARAAWRPPPAGQWRSVLDQASRDDFEWRAGMWCYWTHAMRALPLEAESVSDLPLEEVVTLLAIRDIAARGVKRP